MTLARYLRDYLELTGTKVSCNQSGCGACTVTAEIPDPSDPNSLRTKSVNSVSIRTILGFVDHNSIARTLFIIHFYL